MPRDLEFHGLAHGKTPLSEKAARFSVISPKMSYVLSCVAFFFFSAFIFWPLVFRAMDIEAGMQ